MKSSERRVSEARRQHTEAVVARHVYQLFQRLPMLAGFWVRPDLAERAGERPEAVPLMRGRTFAPLMFRWERRS